MSRPRLRRLRAHWRVFAIDYPVARGQKDHEVDAVAVKGWVRFQLQALGAANSFQLQQSVRPDSFCRRQELGAVPDWNTPIQRSNSYFRYEADPRYPQSTTIEERERKIEGSRAFLTSPIYRVLKCGKDPLRAWLDHVLPYLRGPLIHEWRQICRTGRISSKLQRWIRPCEFDLMASLCLQAGAAGSRAKSGRSNWVPIYTLGTVTPQRTTNFHNLGRRASASHIVKLRRQ